MTRPKNVERTALILAVVLGIGSATIAGAAARHGSSHHVHKAFFRAPPDCVLPAKDARHWRAYINYETCQPCPIDHAQLQGTQCHYPSAVMSSVRHCTIEWASTDDLSHKITFIGPCPLTDQKGGHPLPAGQDFILVPADGSFTKKYYLSPDVAPKPGQTKQFDYSIDGSPPCHFNDPAPGTGHSPNKQFQDREIPPVITGDG